MSRYRWWIVVAGVCGLIVSGVLFAIWRADQQELLQAQARWQQAPQHYQIDLSIWGDEVTGSFRAEIKQQQIVSIISMETGQPAPDTTTRALSVLLPMEQLFTRVEETLPISGRVDNVLRRRYPLARAAFEYLGHAQPHPCWQPTMEAVAYDSQWGYPSELRWSSNRCDDGMFSLDMFYLKINAFQPLP